MREWAGSSTTRQVHGSFLAGALCVCAFVLTLAIGRVYDRDGGRIGIAIGIGFVLGSGLGLGLRFKATASALLTKVLRVFFGFGIAKEASARKWTGKGQGKWAGAGVEGDRGAAHFC